MDYEQSDWKSRLRQIGTKPYVSVILVAINVIVFLICTRTGDLLYNKGGVGLRVVMETGQFYRIITSMFLHADARHLFGNMILLIALADMLESKVGHWKYLLIYLLSGIFGNLCSMFMEFCTGHYVYSVGASGAVYGICGVMLGAAVFRDCRNLRIDPVRVILVVGYSVYTGFRSTGINNAAHVGGLISGFGLYAIFYLVKKHSVRKTVNGGSYEG